MESTHKRGRSKGERAITIRNGVRIMAKTIISNRTKEIILTSRIINGVEIILTGRITFFMILLQQVGLICLDRGILVAITVTNLLTNTED